MPKLKTHRGAAKRLRLTRKGKIKRSKAYGSHLKTKKDSKRVSHLRKSTLISGVDKKRIKRLLPYGEGK